MLLTALSLYSYMGHAIISYHKLFMQRILPINFPNLHEKKSQISTELFTVVQKYSLGKNCLK